jgi:uncharacterized protein
MVTRDELFNFIQDPSFPCLMAKVVAQRGLLQVFNAPGVNTDADGEQALQALYAFIDEYRIQPERLSSFALVLKDHRKLSFHAFESVFWSFLATLNRLDKARHPHDPRVSSDVKDKNFSFSLKSEAFFILALHPESPRWSRRFKFPAIIFNPHAQFERMRMRGTFEKVRNLIRIRDRRLQGSSNPMLADFGDQSEVYQYLGRKFSPGEEVPLFSGA